MNGLDQPVCALFFRSAGFENMVHSALSGVLSTAGLHETIHMAGGVNCHGEYIFILES
jgi:hypothetical protein